MISEHGKVIHFIIPCHRSSQTLVACLDSILGLQYPRELIKISVVEYGVRDSQIRELLQHYDVAHHFLAQNSPAHAYNYLLGKIDEELIAYIDADVILDREWAIHCLKEITGLGVACVNCSH